MARMIRILLYEGPSEWLDEIETRNGVKGLHRVNKDSFIAELISVRNDKNDWSPLYSVLAKQHDFNITDPEGQTLFPKKGESNDR